MERGVQPRRQAHRHRVCGQDGAAVGRRDRQAEIGEPLKAMRIACMSAAFSPDGKRIVTASADKTARLWDAETGKPIGEPLKGHEDCVYERGVQPRRQAHRHRVCGQDGAAVGRRDRQADRRAAQGHEDGVYERGVQPRRQAHRHRVCGQDGAAVGRRDRQARSASRSKAMRDRVSSAAFSPDGKRIVTASGDKTARLWDVLPHPGDRAWALGASNRRTGEGDRLADLTSRLPTFPIQDAPEDMFAETRVRLGDRASVVPDVAGSVARAAPS